MSTGVLGTPTVVELLELVPVTGGYRSVLVLDDQRPIYGGQVVAQALLAAGRTVPDQRLPHSLHACFLRGGDAGAPVEYRIEADHDGRSFSARRVTAVQGGQVIFTMAASFHLPESGPDHETTRPSVQAPPADAATRAPNRVLSVECHYPEQAAQDGRTAWPLTRFWARATVPLPEDPLVHACVLAYVSDTSTGLAPLHDARHRTRSSLDHAVWFHRPVRADDWVLFDLDPQTVAGGRGWYTGTVHRGDGDRVASLAQEVLFRAERPPA